VQITMTKEEGGFGKQTREKGKAQFGAVGRKRNWLNGGRLSSARRKTSCGKGRGRTPEYLRGEREGGEGGEKLFAEVQRGSSAMVIGRGRKIEQSCGHFAVIGERSVVWAG